MKNEHLTAGVYRPSQDVEHSVQIFLCSIFFATSEKQWSWMSANTEDRNRVWRVIFKLLTIQIHSFLWYSLQHLKVGEVVCQSTLRRGGGSQVSKSERPWLQILCKSTERANKQVSRQSLKQRGATEIISGSLLVLLILSQKPLGFTERERTLCFPQFSFSSPVDQKFECVLEEFRSHAMIWRDTTSQNPLSKKSAVNQSQPNSEDAKYWESCAHTSLLVENLSSRNPSIWILHTNPFISFPSRQGLRSLRNIFHHHSCSNNLHVRQPYPALQYGSELNPQCWFETHQLVLGRHIF